MEILSDAAFTELTDSVKEIKGTLERIERGLYGDPVNGFLGVMGRQAALEKEFLDMKEEIRLIKEKNAEQDTALKTKKSVWSWVLKGIQWAALAYLVFKGMVGIDTAIGGKIF